VSNSTSLPRLAKLGQAGEPPDRPEETFEDSHVTDWNAAADSTPELARAKANSNLVAALVNLGWSAGGAAVLARACVRPDEVRRHLNSPVEVRVPGGTMLVIETAVFSPGVTIYPTNLRELGNRLYPLGMTDGDHESAVISAPTTDQDHSCQLVLSTRGPNELSERLRSSESWLSRHNPLSGDVALEGVLQPVTLVGMRVDHENGAPAEYLLTAADGSSRTTATHKILGLDAADLVYRIGKSDRLFRQQISALLRLLREKDWTDLADEDRRRIRALTMPARIVVGFRKEDQRGVDFDTAVRSLIGLMHIAPPLSYGTDVEHDATADAVLDVLRRPSRGKPARITDDEARWFAAVMTPAERDAIGLPSHPDVRAADITRVLLHGGRSTAMKVNAGVRSITARNSPTPDERVAIAVELILRPWRTAHAGDEKLNLTARRSAMQRAYGMQEIGREPDEPLLEGFPDSRFSLQDLLDQALEEVDEGRGRSRDKPLASAQIELGTKAAYYLILAEPIGLRRESPASGRSRDGEPVDQRSPSAVLTAMLSTMRGVVQAHSIIHYGRQGKPLWEVDENGDLTHDRSGKRIVLTDELVRSTYGGRGLRSEASTGLAAAELKWHQLLQGMQSVERATTALAAVKSESGRSYLDEQGWPEADVDEVLRRLHKINFRLTDWGERWLARQEDSSDDEA
jgi:hypothetical protein